MIESILIAMILTAFFASIFAVYKISVANDDIDHNHKLFEFLSQNAKADRANYWNEINAINSRLDKIEKDNTETIGRIGRMNEDLETALETKADIETIERNGFAAARNALQADILAIGAITTAESMRDLQTAGTTLEVEPGTDFDGKSFSGILKEADNGSTEEEKG